MTEPVKISFLVEVSKYVGYGHFVETINLIKALKKMSLSEFTVFFVGQRDCLDEIKKEGITKIYFIDGLNEQSEISFLTESLKSSGCEKLVVNHPFKNEKYFKSLSKLPIQTYAIFDDGIHRQLDISAIINCSILMNDYNGILDSRHLYGSKYHLLDQDCLVRDSSPFKVDGPYIVVTMGGTDPYNLTEKIINMLADVDIITDVHIVFGGGYDNESFMRINHNVKKLKAKLVFHKNLPKKEMLSLMRNAYIAITSPGDTIYELSLMGIPSLIVSHHDLHLQIANKFEKLGAAINLGLGVDLDKGVLFTSLKSLITNVDLRERIKDRAMSVTDGLGLNRVSEFILSGNII